MSMSNRENCFVLKIEATPQDLDAMQTAVGSLNADPVQGHPPGTLLFAAYDATPIDASRAWFAVDIEFQVLATDYAEHANEGSSAHPDRFHMVAAQPRLAESSTSVDGRMPD